MPKEGYRVITVKKEDYNQIVKKADRRGTTVQEYLRMLVSQDKQE